VPSLGIQFDTQPLECSTPWPRTAVSGVPVCRGAARSHGHVPEACHGRGIWDSAPGRARRMCAG